MINLLVTSVNDELLPKVLRSSHPQMFLVRCLVQLTSPVQETELTSTLYCRILLNQFTFSLLVWTCNYITVNSNYLFFKVYLNNTFYYRTCLVLLVNDDVRLDAAVQLLLCRCHLYYDYDSSKGKIETFFQILMEESHYGTKNTYQYVTTL